MRTLRFGLCWAGLVLAGIAGLRAAERDETMNAIAESYVKLVLGVGLHDADYVDAYYGPAEFKTAVDAERPTVAVLRERATELLRAVGKVDVAQSDEIVRLRHSYLARQLAAVAARLEMLEGRRFSFDEESARLYDAVAPTHPIAHFEQLLAELEHTLPGTGPLPQRLEAFRKDFIIPPEKVAVVMQTAIEEARRRTAAHLALPPEESFTVEYVTKKPWSAYNWYQGGFHSLIQVNTDLPIFIERAIDLACHEGYPGHHVYNVLLEKHLVRERGWVEFSIYPLFSPQSLIAEGTGNYGIEVAFPGEQRILYARDVLFPLAGLNPARAEEYARVLELTRALTYAGNEAARRYLDGAIAAATAQDWLNRYALMEPARAAQRVKFIERYRSYVINYNLGQDLVAAYVERRAGGEAAARWRVFGELISTPRLPSEIK